ncbi:MAG: hypothetical protein J7493_14960 [Porphyrobacter sp.]|nr:hypothetical protein [Porphyrobacter sp.]
MRYVPENRSAPFYSCAPTIQTKVGKLLDDPAAAEILKRLIPKAFANEMFQTL